MINHENTEQIICPYCGQENDQLEELLEFDGEAKCIKCNNVFTYFMTIKYTTSKM